MWLREQHNPRTQLELFHDQPEMVEFLKMASHGQVMLSMFRETFPKLENGTVLLLDEPEMALSVSNQRRILKMLKELDVPPRQILLESGLNFTVGQNMRDAAEKVVKLAAQ